MVEGISLIEVLTNSVSLQWNRVSGSADVDYTVTWTPSRETTGSKVVGNNENTTTIENLTSNDRYTFQVQASNEGGRGVISPKKSFVTSKKVNF